MKKSQVDVEILDSSEFNIELMKESLGSAGQIIDDTAGMNYEDVIPIAVSLATLEKMDQIVIALNNISMQIGNR